MRSLTKVSDMVNRESSNFGSTVTRQGSHVCGQVRPGRYLSTVQLTIACWNVRNLSIKTTPKSSQPRKSAVIDRELACLNIDIATLSETWLCDSGSIKEDSYTLFWCGCPESDRPMRSCGIAVKNDLLPTMDHPTFISPRLMKTRFLLVDLHMLLL